MRFLHIMHAVVEFIISQYTNLIEYAGEKYHRQYFTKNIVEAELGNATLSSRRRHRTQSQ